MNQYIQDERLRQVFSFHPLLIGGNPFQSTSIYALIHTLERKFGVWYALGGTGALVRGLAQLFQDIGGTLHLDIPNLYFAGAGTHPGVGLPGVMSSGKIVADMIGYAHAGKLATVAAVTK